MKVPFSPPRIDEKIIRAVKEALHSGWITTGPRVRRFEQMLTAYGGQKATLCVNSASAGLELMLRWFGVGPGDEVIVPAYTYAATANVVVHCGARPVFVDSGDDFNVTAETVARAITGRTKVIMPVDIAGWPCDYDALNNVVNAEEYVRMFHPETPEQQMLGRILLLSDAAHSIGAVYKGKRTGSLTDISVYSFHAVKNLTTAEGGAVCLNLPPPFDNQSVYKTLSIKALHGQTKDAMTKFEGGNWRYDIVEPGYKYNMTDIQAAMGIAELERYEEDMLVKRKYIFQRYTEAFSACSWARVPPYENSERISSCHAYLLRVSGLSEQSRDVILRLIYINEVAVNVHFVPLPMFTYYKNAGYNIADYPLAYSSYACEISLPVFYDLTDQMIELVIDTVKHAVEKVRSGHA
ncbi:MAG TPA: DegT/DnrJ/EryC1/StrS aminotransferase family protein [Bacteroidales bacterium]|nr:DegT/DnrJ/EryC1/StrS aminotransferase family protein [Bacteroidales bacterium]HSA43539.1 DegT/DnrJ/EryC1/StrS aminotransferase family protein [Bacteroidales bacterium]